MGDGDRIPIFIIKGVDRISIFIYFSIYIFGRWWGCQSWSVMLMMEQIWAFLETQRVSHSNYSSDLSLRCHDHWSWEKPWKSTCCIAKSSILYMSTSFPTMVDECWWLQNHRVHIVSKKLRLPGFSNSNICFFPQTRPLRVADALLWSQPKSKWGEVFASQNLKKPLVASVQCHIVPGFRVLTIASLWNVSIA